jgi:hypothetical protein
MHEDRWTLSFVLAEFCKFAKMKMNAEKRVSILQAWNGTKAEPDYNPFHIHTHERGEEIRIEMVSIQLGAPT